MSVHLEFFKIVFPIFDRYILDQNVARAEEAFVAYANELTEKVDRLRGIIMPRVIHGRVPTENPANILLMENMSTGLERYVSKDTLRVMHKRLATNRDTDQGGDAGASSASWLCWWCSGPAAKKSPGIPCTQQMWAEHHPTCPEKDKWKPGDRPPKGRAPPKPDGKGSKAARK
jgi:hypothetical protein